MYYLIREKLATEEIPKFDSPKIDNTSSFGILQLNSLNLLEAKVKSISIIKTIAMGIEWLSVP